MTDDPAPLSPQDLDDLLAQPDLGDLAFPEQFEGEAMGATRRLMQLMGTDAFKQFMIQWALQNEAALRARFGPEEPILQLLDEHHRMNGS